jgi:hypothetical protein
MSGLASLVSRATVAFVSQQRYEMMKGNADE